MGGPEAGTGQRPEAAPPALREGARRPCWARAWFEEAGAGDGAHLEVGGEVAERPRPQRPHVAGGFSRLAGSRTSCTFSFSREGGGWLLGLPKVFGAGPPDPDPPHPPPADLSGCGWLRSVCAGSCADVFSGRCIHPFLEGVYDRGPRKPLCLCWNSRPRWAPGGWGSGVEARSRAVLTHRHTDMRPGSCGMVTRDSPLGVPRGLLG